jgi:EmrB/QacA subfamily drug resistance transporter
MTTPSSRGDTYWPNVLLALLATCPGLINATALTLVSPTIAAGVGASTTAVSWVPLAGNAALAVGGPVAADLSQRVPPRRLFPACLALFAVGSLVVASAPVLWLLIAGRLLQGFGSGLLLVIAIPLLFAPGLSPARLRLSSGFVVIGLFGAATAGPVLGGLVAQAEAWRWLFAANAALGVLAIPLALRVLPRRPAPAPHRRVDAPALLLTALGVGLTFFGVGELGWHDWDAVAVSLPVALGVLALIAVVVVEALQEDPLMPVRLLARPAPIVGAILAIVAGAAFTGTLSILPLYLARVRGLSAQDTGLLLWPAVLAAVVAAVVVGVVSGSRLRPLVALGGFVLLALGAWALTGLTATTGDGQILLLSAVLGFGAGVTIAPGIILAALSVPGPLIGRALALINLFRLVGAYLAAPPLIHAIGTHTTIHAADLAAQVQAGSPASLAVTAQITRLVQFYTAHGVPPTLARAQASATLGQALYRQALVLGISDVCGVVVILTVLGIIAVALILASAALWARRAARHDAVVPTTGHARVA